MSIIQVMVVDDHRIVRDGLEQLVIGATGLNLVGSAADGETAVEQAIALRPDVVLMDLSMPGIGGVEATRRIRAEVPDCKVVVLTSYSEQQRVVAALDAGADGYLLKHAEPDQILDAIRAAAAGGAPLDPQVARSLLNVRQAAPEPSDITGREREVLGLVTEGLANKQIARRLGISERTVKAHLTSIFQRIGVSDRTQAAMWARDHL
jgi:DNA-binding NarL/FixJ family response regulator